MSNRHRILVACMPKSGSTYLTAILSNLPNFKATSWVPDYGRREQELCYQRLQADRDAFANLGLVAQHHVRYSDVTERYIKEFDLKPVVLVRNLYDIIPSLIDHHRIESVVYPMAFAPADITGWDFERAAKFITYMVLPWYFNFFLSWNDCPEKILVTYEDLITNPVEIVQSICANYGIDASKGDIVNALERAKNSQTRKNVGVFGRGSRLSEHCRRYIKEMASFYDGLDFSKIGL
jgi:hypothetical protein